jgi:signal transduction histidine kinase
MVKPVGDEKRSVGRVSAVTVPDEDGSSRPAPARFRFRVRLGTRLFLSLTLFLAVVMALVLMLVERRMDRMTRMAEPTVERMHQQIADTKAALMLVFAGAMLAGGLASYLMARRITGPLRHLVAGADRAAQGRLDTRLDVHTGDELEELSRTFNRMVSQIQANQRAVADMNVVLEEKVRERTEDLSRMNDELRTAYAEMTQIEGQVIAAEKMASIGQLVAGICHEINTPNSAITAAVVNMTEYLDALNRQLRMLLAEGVPAAVEERFFKLVELSLRAPTHRTGTAEIRQHARVLEAKLTRYGVRTARELSVTFTRLNLGDEVVAFIEASREEASVSSMLCLSFLENVGQLAVAVQDIRMSTDTISRMVKALKSYARTEKARKGYSHLDPPDMVEADVHEGLETALTLLRNQIKYGVVVERRYGKVPPIICSSDELNQVWTNIIHNAVQAMKGMGKILIETYRRGEHGIGVRITDSGPGIPKENVNRIFDPFFTTKGQGEGSGLGLSISQQIVERHDGEIRVDSQPGRTSFEVLLPLQPTLVAKRA